MFRLDHVTFDSSKSTANIYFSREYNECDNSVKLLLNAGIVKMLTQINGVSYVQFYADGSVAEYPDGTQIGLLSM